jgi:protease-4
VARAISATCKDPSVKGLVVRLDSRGGSAVASDSIRRELERAKDMGLPIVVSMGSFAASGGYYIATAADKIVAQPGTITGSIGAFIGVVSLQQLFERVGISVGEVAVGQDPISVARPLSATQKEKLDKAGRQVYDDFVALVAKARKLSAAEVDAVARGRVWTGAHAKTLGLVDELGGIEEAHDLKAQ